MPVNSYLEWSDEEIQTLEKLYLNDIPMEQIAKVLGRTPRAIELAVKNLLLQEVLHRNTRDVSRKYNIPMENMYAELVPQKYFLESKKDDGFPIVLGMVVLYVLVAILGYIVMATENKL